MDREELYASDSDDADYIPPTDRSAKGGSASRSAAHDSDSDSVDSDTADAFYVADAVPEHPDSDVDRPPAHVYGALGAGPSSATGASSSAARASSSAAAGPSSARQKAAASSIAGPTDTDAAASQNGVKPDGGVRTKSTKVSIQTPL